MPSRLDVGAAVVVGADDGVGPITAFPPPNERSDAPPWKSDLRVHALPSGLEKTVPLRPITNHSPLPYAMPSMRSPANGVPATTVHVFPSVLRLTAPSGVSVCSVVPPAAAHCPDPYASWLPPCESPRSSCRVQCAPSVLWKILDGSPPWWPLSTASQVP